MATLLQDLRYGARMLRKSPGFAVVAVITLALGIGSNTAIFSVVNSVLLQPLSLREPGEVVRLQEYHQRALNLTGATLRDIRERNRVFSEVAGYRIFSQNLSAPGGTSAPEEIDAAFVSPEFLPLMGVRPFLGGGFTSEQFQANGEAAVILGYGLWQRHFGSDSTIVGRTVILHGVPHVVMGVMPLAFTLPESVQAWVPLTADVAFPENRRAHLFVALARIRKQVSPQVVQDDLQSIAAQIQQENPNVDPGFELKAQRLQENLVSGVRLPLLMLLGAVAFVLLIACANVANLLLSRSVARQQEIAVRTALGATRFRLLRQLLTESLLIGLVGGTTGCLLGLWSVKLLYGAYAGAVPGLPAPTIHPMVLLFVFAISLLASLLFGSIPALQFAGRGVQTQLAEGGRSSTGSKGRVSAALVISEVALAMLLLASAGLLIRSFVILQQIDPGFDASHLAVLRLTLPDSRYPELPQRVQFVDSVLERLRALPGVQAGAASGTLPFDETPVTDLELEGHAYDPENEPEAEILTATPQYFRTMGIRVLEGRTFTAQDIAGRPTALVINQTMARRFWPGQSALGKRVVMKDWGPPLPGQIVGVVSDVKQDSLETATQPAIYYSFAQFEPGTLTTYLIVRTAGAPLDLAAAMRDQVWAVDRDQPVNVVLMEQIISGSLERRRYVLVLLGTFAGLALLLAVVGIYGVIAYSVVQRTREFGIRMALGAQPRQVLLMILRQSARTVSAGLALGILAGLAATRVIKSLLFGIGPGDPLTFSIMAAILLGVALAASVIPARRAARVDPLVALRYE